MNSHLWNPPKEFLLHADSNQLQLVYVKYVPL